VDAHTGGGTAAGDLAIPAVGRSSDRTLDLLPGFTAEVMLAATSFSLLEPALERGRLWEVAVGFVLGGASLAALDIWLPHAHERFAERGHAPPRLAPPRQRALMLLAPITIRNVPEGLAVGVAFAARGIDLGVPFALAITLQTSPRASPPPR
jgi:zinc transporter, ZIP family